MEKDEKEPARIDPDPFSLLLAALGGMGSIVSIASYVEGRREKSLRTKRARSKFFKSLRILALDCEEIEFCLHRLEILIESVPQEFSDHAEKIGFGHIQLMMTHEEFREYDLIAYRLSKAFRTATSESYELMCSAKDSELMIGDKELYRLKEIQQRMNMLLQPKFDFREQLRKARYLCDDMKIILERIEHNQN